MTILPSLTVNDLGLSLVIFQPLSDLPSNRLMKPFSLFLPLASSALITANGATNIVINRNLLMGRPA